jgi:hypothetical protein
MGTKEPGTKSPKKHPSGKEVGALSSSRALRKAFLKRLLLPRRELPQTALKVSVVRRVSPLIPTGTKGGDQPAVLSGANRLLHIPNPKSDVVHMGRIVGLSGFSFFVQEKGDSP